MDAIWEKTLCLGPGRCQLVVQKRIRRARLGGTLLIDRDSVSGALCSRRARLASIFLATGVLEAGHL